MCCFLFIGNFVRVDTTLKGFEQMNWQRGNQSFIFKAGGLFLIIYGVAIKNITFKKKKFWSVGERIIL